MDWHLSGLQELKLRCDAGSPTNAGVRTALRPRCHCQAHPHSQTALDTKDAASISLVLMYVIVLLKMSQNKVELEVMLMFLCGSFHVLLVVPIYCS